MLVAVVASGNSIIANRPARMIKLWLHGENIRTQVLIISVFPVAAVYTYTALWAFRRVHSHIHYKAAEVYNN